MNDIYKFISVLTETEKKVLEKLYYLRTLNVEQAYSFCANPEEISSINEFVSKSITRLTKTNCIEVIPFNYNFILFLTPDGVNVVRILLNLPTSVVHPQNGSVSRGYHRASELKMKDRLINHQLHLNQFLLQFESFYRKYELTDNYHYFDEKHLSSYREIRPDALLQFDNFDLLLEMDMGTESKKQLEAKWEHYRKYLTKQSYTNPNHRPMIVFFICEGTTRLIERKDLVAKTSHDVLGYLFSERFEIFTGNSASLLKLFFEQLLPYLKNKNDSVHHARILLQEYHGFDIYMVNEIIPEELTGNYSLFLRHVCEITGAVTEMLFDDWRLGQISILTNIAYLNQNSFVLNQRIGKDYHYLLLIDDLNKVHTILSQADLLSHSKLVFTTVDRLMNLSLHEALFIMTPNREIHSFKDESLTHTVYESNF